MNAINDVGCRAAEFIATLRRHGMRNVYEAQVFHKRHSKVLDRKAKMKRTVIAIGLVIATGAKAEFFDGNMLGALPRPKQLRPD